MSAHASPAEAQARADTRASVAAGAAGNDSGVRLSDLSLTRAEAVAIGKATLEAARIDDVPSLSAGVAFRIFLSLFPGLVVTVAVFSLVTDPADLASLLSRLGEIAPPAVVQVVAGPLNDLVAEGGAAGLALIGGLLTGMWAISSAAVTLMKALSRAYNVAETRKFLGQRALALVIMLALLAALIGMFLLLVIGPAVQSWIGDRLLLTAPAEATTSVLLTVGRYGLAVLVLMVLFAFMYWIGPDRRPRPPWRWITPGAVVGVLGWLLLSYLFSVYARVGGAADNPAYAGYAGLGAVIVLLLWLQLSMVALLLGGELNAELIRWQAKRQALEEGAGFAAAAPVGVGPHAVPVTVAGQPPVAPEGLPAWAAGGQPPVTAGSRLRPVAMAAAVLVAAVAAVVAAVRHGQR